MEFRRFNHEIHQFPLFMQHPTIVNLPQNQEMEKRKSEKLAEIEKLRPLYRLVVQTKNRGFRLFGVYENSWLSRELAD